MNEWITLLLNVGIGSVIGGVTNELAIRMLFRPYNPWMIGSFRVPFTPGLIPRRRDQIGREMGNLVENHLLTKEGIRRALSQGNMENTLRDWLTGYAQKWITSDQTIREVLTHYLPGTLTPEGTWNDSLRDPVQKAWISWSDKWLVQSADKEIRDLLPPEAREKLHDTIGSFGDMMIRGFRDYLHSPEGVNHIQNMLKGVLGGGGGMFGGLMGMFLGDDKIIGKIMPFLDDILENPELSARLKHFMRIEADKLMGKKVGEVLKWIGDEQVDAWRIKLFAKMEEQSLRLLDKPVKSVLAPFGDRIVEDWIPKLSAWAVNTLEANVEQVFDRLHITEIVAKQVEGFPLERIEEMIVGISGKEFRMITVLGFVLGAIIGLVQGLINFWL
ncbi:DUF445 domain-containing protein [Brevibacillus dissolubilis]|uniref:DUF445 domain-containing protein n=1 Tax=Brevibacillus dissolubilis TaxID=1844116 RepID=UPI0011170004|nr:DUF445 family protein [Brevibacillus dissolubilis]